MSRFRVFSLLIALSLCLSLFPASQGAQAADEPYVFRRSWGGEWGKLVYPEHIVIGPDGTIYVTVRYGRISVIHPEEHTYAVWENPGSNAGKYEFLGGIDVDENGNVYLADSGNNRIVILTSQGDLLTQWGTQGSEAGQFDRPGSIAVDKNGDVYVADTGNDRIQKFTSQGIYLTEWGSQGIEIGQFDFPSDIAIDENGIIYVLDKNNNRIQIFTSQGIYLSQWGENGEGAGHLNYPADITIDKNGFVYASDSIYNCIQKFTTQGVYISQWGSIGNGAGQFNSPMGVAVNESGNVYVADFINNRIQKFSNQGDYLMQWGNIGSGDGQFNEARGIAIDGDGNVYLADTYNHRIQKFTAQGSYILQWGSEGSEAGQFNLPWGIVVDRNGNIFVVDDNNRIQKFTANGVFITQWGSQGSEAGQFNYPSGIAVDKDGNIFVADSGNDRIQVFNSQGVYLTQWGSYGTGAGQFTYPIGIAVDMNGNVYVMDGYYGIRIEKFTSQGNYLLEWTMQPGKHRVVTADGNGNVYVADYFNSLIIKYDNEGNLLEQWYIDDNSNAWIRNQPSAIAVNVHGAVYVTDEEDRVQVFTPGLPTSDSCTGLVQNGFFEASPALNEWTYGGSLPVSPSSHAIQGDQSLLLGKEKVSQKKEQGEGQAWAHTTFYVPPDWERPILYFHYNLFVNDIMDYSDFFVAIQDRLGLNHLATVLRDGYKSNIRPPAGKDLGWRSASYDLSAFKGQHIRLVFSNRNLWPKSLGIWSFVDDVRVLDAGPVSNKPNLLAPADGTVLTTGRPSFCWVPVPDVSKYTLRISPTPSFNRQVKTYTVSVACFTSPKDLPVNSTLYWQVKINKKGVENPWSDTRFFTFPPSVPNPTKPANNVLVPSYPLLLDWSDSSVPAGAPAFDHYQVQVDDTPDFSSPAIDTSVYVSTYSLVAAPASNTRYGWRVCAFNTTGQCLGWSKVRSFRTRIATPSLYSPGNGTIAGSARPVFDWDDPAGATSYIIQISKNADFSGTVVKTTAKISIYQPTKNLPNGILYWRVQAKGANGPSAWSTPWSVIIP